MEATDSDGFLSEVPFVNEKSKVSIETAASFIEDMIEIWKLWSL